MVAEVVMSASLEIKNGKGKRGGGGGGGGGRCESRFTMGNQKKVDFVIFVIQG